MPNRKSNPHIQPKLLAEPQSEYQPTAEEIAEKERYRQRLAEYLKDPAFRQIEGFPIGEDEAILALSDPPYYTACPNPFLGEIIERWQKERQALRKEMGLPDDSQENGFQIYHREPFAADVSEGKNDPVYNAHSYHTKVPHKAIMRYILHYTDPGDIVFDGFCGTGMTGVAAQLCGDTKTVESLGYIVQKDGRVLDENGQAISRPGARKAILIDLSPAATFITYNYNTPVDTNAFECEVERILAEVENECSWMYETWHPDCENSMRVLGKINYTVWSDIFVCPQCGNEMAFWDVAVDHIEGNIRDIWKCPHCTVQLSKNPNRESGITKVERAQITDFDHTLGKAVQRAKQVPVLINYSVDNQRFDKLPDVEDSQTIHRIGGIQPDYWFPTTRIDKDIDIWYERDYRSLGIYSIEAFFTKRNLLILSLLWKKASEGADSRVISLVRFVLTSMQVNLSRLNRWRANVSFPYNPLSGTLYVSALQSEANVIVGVQNKVNRLLKALSTIKFIQPQSVLINTQSATNIPAYLRDNTVDYIFTDPPFGSNIIYSDLSIIWESWLDLFTNTSKEAVIHRRKKHHPTTIDGYSELMVLSYSTMHRLLKPGRWITIEFHNTQNAVWNTIQEALIRAGFMVADVRTLDKQQGSFKQVTTSSAVKQDLVISAYKPTATFERQFLVEAGSSQGVWTFMRQHLEQLPLPVIENGTVEALSERQNYLLYDRMVAFHLVRGLAVPLSASEFYQGLAQRYLERDGMYFTPAQAADYDRLRLKAERVEQLALFVTDEKSAVQWLRQALDPSLGGEPQTYQDLQPKFIQQLHQARHEKLPELRQMLEENFLQDEAERWYNPNPDRKADLEALRLRTLLREYKEYLKGKGRLKVFRSEAVRAGFSVDWKEHNYADIVQIAERLPESVLQEDSGLLMYYHNASLRLSDQPKQAKLF